MSLDKNCLLALWPALLFPWRKRASLLSVLIWPFIYHPPLILGQKRLAACDGSNVLCTLRKSLFDKLLEKGYPCNNRKIISKLGDTKLVCNFLRFCQRLMFSDSIQSFCCPPWTALNNSQMNKSSSNTFFPFFI